MINKAMFSCILQLLHYCKFSYTVAQSESHSLVKIWGSNDRSPRSDHSSLSVAPASDEGPVSANKNINKYKVKSFSVTWYKDRGNRHCSNKKCVFCKYIIISSRMSLQRQKSTCQYFKLN